MSCLRFKQVLLCMQAAVFVSCGSDSERKLQVSLQEVRTEHSDGLSFLSFDVLTTKNGKVVPCNQGTVDVEVSIGTHPDDTFEPLAADRYEVRCTNDESADLALVVDNSGSEGPHIDMVKKASRKVLNAVAERQGRVSLVRVSTDSKVWSGLTRDYAAVDAQINELRINRGWTALYDGIRMGNETLGEPLDTADETKPSDSLQTFCTDDRKLGVVVFTDARENNSENQKENSTEYPGDGIDTKVEDLYDLEVNDVRTPVYTVGLGTDVDHEFLEDLADYTGGRHHKISGPSELEGVFEMIANYLPSNIKVCTELPEELCGPIFVKVAFEWRQCDSSKDGECSGDGGEVMRGENVYPLHIACPLAQTGTSVTVLLTLTDPDQNDPNLGMERETAGMLVDNILSYLNMHSESNIIVLKDDNHHNEFAHPTKPGDPEYVLELMHQAKFNGATIMDEPRKGVDYEDIKDADLVWLVNPGYAPDDKKTLRVLEEFSEAGGNYVLQGDDFSWFYKDRSYTRKAMKSFTGLKHIDNGTEFCGRRINNNREPNRYRVKLTPNTDWDSATSGATHAILAGIADKVFYYGDDIDNSQPANDGEQVLAWADGVDKNLEPYCKDQDKKIPVIVVKQRKQ